MRCFFQVAGRFNRIKLKLHRLIMHIKCIFLKRDARLQCPFGFEGHSMGHRNPTKFHPVGARIHYIHNLSSVSTATTRINPTKSA
jgi:hypothetical protein